MSTDIDFMARGLCAQTDPEAFYPEKGQPAMPAKKVCRNCTVRAECLEYALANDERFGVWGGMTERERAALRKRQHLPTRTQRNRSNKADTARHMYAQGRPKADIASALRLSGSTLNAYLTQQPATPTT